jgi:protein-serine/threonine kinase
MKRSPSPDRVRVRTPPASGVDLLSPTSSIASFIDSNGEASSPSKLHRKGSHILSVLKSLINTGKTVLLPCTRPGKITKLLAASGNSVADDQQVPVTPPQSPKSKSALSQGLAKMSSTLFKAPLEPTIIHRHTPKGRPSLLSFDNLMIKQFMPDSPSSSNSHSPSSNSSAKSSPVPDSTGKTSLDSKFSSSKEQHSSDKRRFHLNPVTKSSDEPKLKPIQETAVDQTYPTVATVEKAAAAKVYLETFFNEKLCSASPRSMRRQALEARLHYERALTQSEKQEHRRAFYSQETEHLRETRILKSRSGSKLKVNGVSGQSLSKDYEVVKVLGKGSFGVVRLVREKDTVADHHTRKQVYAMKVIRKSDMIRTSQEGHLRAERDFLVQSEGSEWVVPLVASFQDLANLYLVMEYMPGGDFLGLLIRENILHETVARFYIAEMILCVEAAHTLRFIHRDIKPDNFLISASGHLKISDFGLAFDGHWSHDTSYYNCHRYSLLGRLQINVDGDDQDKADNKSLTATMKWASGIMSGIEKHEKPAQAEAEPLLNWRNRCGCRTSAMSVVGTSQYMAPEVVEGRKYDGRCD